MRNPINFIIDFETMGQDVLEVPILDAAYMTFDWSRFTSSNPYTFEELTSTMPAMKVDVKEQVEKYGCKFTQRDVQWWADQGPEQKKKIQPSPNDLTLNEFCDNLLKYIEQHKVGIWWSRGNSFDPTLLHRAMKSTGNLERINEALKFWNVRDTRTYIDAKFDFSIRNTLCPVPSKDKWKQVFKGHDSTHDVAADILRLQAIVRGENDLTQVDLQ